MAGIWLIFSLFATACRSQPTQSNDAPRVTLVAVEKTSVPADTPSITKDLVVCMTQEPDTLYPYGSTMLAAQAIRHAIFENNYTTLAFDYQAQSLVKLPDLADGDAGVRRVLVEAGDRVVTAAGVPKSVAVGDEIVNAAGETVLFEGVPVEMSQLVVDFNMKPTVFADGIPVKATDSVYSFQLASHPDALADQSVSARTERYEATGPLSTRWTGLPGYMDSTYFVNFWPPLPEHLWGEVEPEQMSRTEAAGRLPVGDGPFRMVEWVPGERIRLDRNEYYYRATEGLPYLDSVTFEFVPDIDQLKVRLLAGRCDIVTHDSLNPNDVDFLYQTEAAGLIVPYFEPGTAFEHIDFNINPYGDYAKSRYDWFGDKRVRQALILCTDRQSMVDGMMAGQTEIMHAYVPAIHPLYPAEGLKEWPYDLELANALLDEAGYDQRDAKGFRLDPAGGRFAPRLITTANNPLREAIARKFQADQKACGIDVAVDLLPANELFAAGPAGPLFGRRYDLALFAWLTGVEPPCSYYTSMQIPGPTEEINPQTGLDYSGWGGNNSTGYANPMFDRACLQGIQNLSGTPAHEAGHIRAQLLFAEELPVIPLFPRVKIAAAGRTVLNFSLDATQPSELYNVYEIDLVRPQN